MKLEKYFNTNCASFYWELDEKTKKTYKKYIHYIKKLNNNSRVIEIWPWNWSFLVYIQEQFNLKSDNIETTDLSESVIDELNSNNVTKFYNNNLCDSIEYFDNKDKVYDLIILKHVLEHMQKDYITKLIPLLEKSLKIWWQILIEVPNVISFPFWFYMYFWDFSHYTPFADKSLKEAILWHSDNLSFDVYNLLLYNVDRSSIISTIKSSIIKSIYVVYIYWFLWILKLSGLPIQVFTSSILGVATKK